MNADRTTAPRSAVSPLYVESFGKGVPVLLLHSSGLSGRQWRRLALALEARGFRAVVPDLSGHGRSAPWPEPEPFTYRRDVAAVVALLQAEPSAHLVGHSYGGLIALLAGIEVPAAVRSVTVFDPVAFGVLSSTEDADVGTALDEVKKPWGNSEREHDAWLEGFVDYWGGAGAWLALREEARAEFRRVGWVVQEGVTTLIADDTERSAYRGVECPVTLLGGELSPLAARRVIQRLGAALPNAQAVAIPGSGHMGPLTHQNQVNDLVLQAIGVR